MKRAILTIAAATSAAVLAAPTPAMADIKSGELGRAYQKGKKDSLFGTMSMRDELRCFQHWTVMATLGATYDINIAAADGELGYGFSQIQFGHYALRWSEHAQGSPGYRETFLEVIDEVGSVDYEKEKNQKRLATALGQCAVPLDRIRFPGQDLGRAETFLQRVTNQPFEDNYPKYVKDKAAWDAHAAAWRKGDVVAAAKISLAALDGGDEKTFHVNEYMTAVTAIVDNGMADRLPASAYGRAAYRNPDKFAALAGMDPADFKPRIVNIGASLTAKGGGLAVQNRAEGMARTKCQRQGGRSVRVTSRITQNSSGSDGFTTYEATAQCEFPARIGG